MVNNFLLEMEDIEGKQFSETSCEKIGNTIKYALTKSDEIATKQFENFETLSKKRISKIRIYGSKFYKTLSIKSFYTIE
jgi:hypothetical protein